jgi:membrane fusion protein (multidrug efflux system)
MRGIVMTLLFSTGAFAQEFVLSTSLEPVHALTIRAGIAGQVVSISVQEGQQVVRGDTLIVLENQELTLDAKTAAIDLKKSQVHLHRARAMRQHGLISVEQMEAVEFENRVTELHHLALQINLDRLFIRAPLNGLVSVVSVKTGDWVTEQAEVACIIDPEDLQAFLFVPEDQLQKIKQGMPVQAVPVGAGGIAFAGEITRISPVIDPENGNCKVLATFPGAGKHVKPGRMVDVHFGATIAASRDKEINGQ